MEDKTIDILGDQATDWIDIDLGEYLVAGGSESINVTLHLRTYIAVDNHISYDNYWTCLSAGAFQLQLYCNSTSTESIYSVTDIDPSYVLYLDSNTTPSSYITVASTSRYDGNTDKVIGCEFQKYSGWSDFGDVSKNASKKICDLAGYYGEYAQKVYVPFQSSRTGCSGDYYSSSAGAGFTNFYLNGRFKIKVFKGDTPVTTKEIYGSIDHLWFSWPMRRKITFTNNSTQWSGVNPNNKYANLNSGITLPSMGSTNTKDCSYDVTISATANNCSSSWSSNAFTTHSGKKGGHVIQWVYGSNKLSPGSTYTVTGYNDIEFTAGDNDWGINDNWATNPWVTVTVPKISKVTGYTAPTYWVWPDSSTTISEGKKEIESPSTAYAITATGTIETYTITFTTWQGATFTKQIQYNTGSGYQLVPLSEIPKRHGYTFKGYYSGDTRYVSDDGKTTITWLDTTPRSLGEAWSPNTNTVNFYMTTSSTSYFMQKIFTQDSPTQIEEKDLPQIVGYRFDGFFTKGDNETKYINWNGTSAKNYDVDITSLYGHWTRQYSASINDGKTWRPISQIKVYTSDGWRNVWTWNNNVTYKNFKIGKDANNWANIKKDPADYS